MVENVYHQINGIRKETIMAISKSFWASLFLVFSLSVGSVGIAMGQDETIQDLNDYTCKDVMRMSGGDRDMAIVGFHAFVLGKKSTTKFNVTKLGEATDRFVEYCLDNPKEKALSVMEKMTK
jgi:hypothetical protein